MDQGEVQSSSNDGAPSANAEESVTAQSEQTQETQSDEQVRKETHLRVLKESQKFKQRALEAEAKARELEEAKLAEQQQWKELAERYKGDLEKERKQRTQLQLKSQLIPKLSAAGCVDVEDAMKLGNWELLMQDPESEMLHGDEDFVKDLKQKKPYLFKSTTTSSVNPSVPTSGLNRSMSGQKLDFSKLSNEQLQAEMRKLDSQLKQGG